MGDSGVVDENVNPSPSAKNILCCGRDALAMTKIERVGQEVGPGGERVCLMDTRCNVEPRLEEDLDQFLAQSPSGSGDPSNG